MNRPGVIALLLGATLGCASQPADESVAVSGGAQAPDSLLANQEFVGRGHEPGWIVRISGDSLHLIANYGEDTVDAMVTQRATADGATTMGTAPELNLTVTVLDEICNDGATGTPHPRVVLVSWRSTSLRGCGGEPRSLLTGGSWAVMDLFDEPVADPFPTMQFTDTGTVMGTTSCNQYSGPYELTPEALRFGPMIATKRACTPPTMAQEQEFLRALERVERFAIPEPGRLALMGAESTVVLARRAR
jgi:heat shock protein HslJ